MDKTATTEFTQDDFSPVILPETGVTTEFSTASFQWVDSMTEYYYDGDKMISSRTYCYHKPDKNVWEAKPVMDLLTADLEYQTDCTIEQETTEEADDAWQPAATVGTCAACQVTPATDTTQPADPTQPAADPTSVGVDDSQGTSCASHIDPSRSATAHVADPTPSEDDDDDDVTYRITPKGCFALSLVHAGICEDVDDPDIDVAWEEFEQSMTVNGYVHSDDEELEFLQ